MLDPAQGSVGGCASSFCGGSRVSRQTHDSHTRETAVRLVVGSTNNVVLIDTNAPHVRCDYIVFAFRYIKRYRSTIVSPKRNLLDLTRTRTKLNDGNDVETRREKLALSAYGQAHGRVLGALGSGALGRPKWRSHFISLERRATRQPRLRQPRPRPSPR